MYYIKGGKWRCKCKCGNELNVDTRNLKSGHTQSCGCLQMERASENTRDMIGFENDGIIVISKAASDTNGLAHWNCKCKHCNSSFISAGSAIRQGLVHSCGCQHSKNERLIAKLLSDNNIEYSKEYTFADLFGKNGGHLRFDFAVFNNGKLSHLIEYNGAQHYIRPKGSWNNNFENLQFNDNLKIEYCKQHNIRLIIIPYNKKYTLEDLL